jgi:RNA polymerase sigma-70 factor (family 1)
MMLLPLPENNRLLFREIAEGDKNAYRTVFDSCRLPFYAAAFKMTRSSYLAEEIVQDVFIILWTKRTQVGVAENPAGYLLTILYNCIYAQFKKIAAEKNFKAGLLHETATSAEAAVDTMLQNKENNQLLQEIIEQLPPQQQRVYRLSRQDGLSRNEIASQLQLSPNSVRNHLFEAIKFIRHYNKKDKKAISMLPLLILPWLF